VQKDANADQVHVRIKMMSRRDEHAAPLIAYTDHIAEVSGLPPGSVPYPDPEHGGTRAEVLFLLSHPGAKAKPYPKGSGMLSLENADPTARACFDQCVRVGLAFDRITHWNAVPVPLPSGAGPSQTDLRTGAQWLPGLLDLLPHLKIVALLGTNARDGWNHAFPTSPLPVEVGPSPGPQGLAAPGARERLDSMFDRIARELGPTPPPDGSS